MSESEKPLWKCPKCGHEFVSENVWHACGRHSLADHFEDSDPKVRELFDRFTAMVEACGPVTIYPEETRIVCQVRVRFAGVVARRRDLDVSVWLTRPVQHTKLRRTEMVPPSTFVHHFRFKHATELDDAFMAIVQEGYAVGRQDHFERGAPRKQRRRQSRSDKRKRMEEGKPQAAAAEQGTPQAPVEGAAATPATTEAPAPEGPTGAATTATPSEKLATPKRKTAKRTTEKTKPPAAKKPTSKRKPGGKKRRSARDEKKQPPKTGGHNPS